MEAIQLQDLMIDHLSALYSFYGEYAEVRLARNHIGGYLKKMGTFAIKSFDSILSAEISESQATLLYYFFKFNYGGNRHEYN